MWQTITANSGGLNVVLNAAMVAVWGVYLHLILAGWRRERRARILINRSAGHDLDANCVITNMSREPVYIEAVCITTDTGTGRDSRSLTDLSSLTRRPDTDPRAYWFQGPLGSSEYLLLGSFRDLLGEATGADPAALQLAGFEILVVATYGPDRAPVGARRSFRAGDNGRWAAERTQQITGWRERRRLRALLREGPGSA